MLVIIISFWGKCNVFMSHVGEEKCWDLLIEVFLSHICPLFFFLFIFYLYIFVFYFFFPSSLICFSGSASVFVFAPSSHHSCFFGDISVGSSSTLLSILSFPSPNTFPCHARVYIAFLAI